MGNLTTIVFWNDDLCETLSNPKELAKEIRYHASGGRETQELNGIKFFKPRHADNHTIYVHMDNTVCEMNPFSDETTDLIENHPKFFDEILGYMEEQLKELKVKRSKYQK